jgi:hypothetical protein
MGFVDDGSYMRTEASRGEPDDLQFHTLSPIAQDRFDANHRVVLDELVRGGVRFPIACCPASI